MRGLKGSVYRGGVRVPFFLRYPALKKGDMDIEAISANIDVLPTIAGICNAAIPNDRKIDGIDLISLITGSAREAKKRPLFFYWTRHSPELYNNIALQKGRYKLVGNTDYNSPSGRFELFDIVKDPYELKNIVKDFPLIAGELKSELDSTFRELAGSENMIDKAYILVGTNFENPIILNRNDADGQWGVWEQEEAYGTWRVIINEGTYNLRFKFIKPVPAGGRMMVETKTFISQMKNEAGETDLIEMKSVFIPAMKCDLVPFYQTASGRILPLWVELDKTD
jgi:arylsulfatase